jgi:hypothetical protein
MTSFPQLSNSGLRPATGGGLAGWVSASRPTCAVSERAGKLGLANCRRRFAAVTPAHETECITPWARFQA